MTPLADERPRLRRSCCSARSRACRPSLGAWIGGFTYSPVWTTLFFAVGAGAIALVVYELWRLFARRAPGGLLAPLNAAGVLAGMLIMYATGLLVTA